MASKSTLINESKTDTIVERISIANCSKESQKMFILTDEQLETILGRLVLSSDKSNCRKYSSSDSVQIGNPGPLGLAAFALTTFMLSVFNAGSNLIDGKLEGVVLPVALFYGGLAQFAAGMWEYRVNNTFGATTFTSYGAFWMSFSAYVYFIVPNIEQTNKVNCATGLFLLSWFIFTLYMNVASWRISIAIFLIFVVLNLTFLFLIIGILGKIPVMINIGGWFGIVTAALAWYASAANIINTTFKKSLLPVGPYKKKERQNSIIITHF